MSISEKLWIGNIIFNRTVISATFRKSKMESWYLKKKNEGYYVHLSLRALKGTRPQFLADYC